MHTGRLHPRAGGMELSSAAIVAALQAHRQRARRVHAIAAAPHFAARGTFSAIGARNEQWLLQALSGFGLRASDVVFDNTEARVPAMYCAAVGAQHVRVVRLNPGYPVYAATAHLSRMAVHISEFAMQRDRVHRKRRLVRDYIDISSAPSVPERPARPFLVSVGRVSESKGHHLAAALSKKLGFPLTVIGPILDERYARRLKKAGCRLVGAITRTRTLGFIQASRGLIWLPTEEEPNGRVIEEAIRLGVEVFGRPYGLIGDIVARGESHSVLRHEGESVIVVQKPPRFLQKSPARVADAYWSIFQEITRRGRP
jgi:glycosyltransferase involved in cell wall biosynthesis